jgi:4-aminobutyrate aminotransferase-like enzyme
MTAFDTDTPERRDALHHAIWADQKMLSLTCGARTIRFRPHLDFTIEEADDGLARIRKALESIAGK